MSRITKIGYMNNFISLNDILMIGGFGFPNVYELTSIYENGRAPDYELRLRELFTDKTKTIKYNIKLNRFADGSKIIKVNNKPFNAGNPMEVELL